MKKILQLLLALFSTISFYGQHRVAAKVQQLNDSHAIFTPYSPLTAVTGTKSADKAVHNATYANLNHTIVKGIAKNMPQTIELTIPYNGSGITVQLYRADVLAKGFHADSDKQANINYTPGAYYRGIIKDDNTSLASFSFFNNEMNGVISSGALNNLVIGRLTNTRSMDDYIIYSDAQLTIANDFNCGANNVAGVLGKTKKEKTAAGKSAQTDHCVTVYFEIDNDIYLQNNSSQVLTGNWLTSVFNNIQTLYDNDGITVSLKSFMVWTTPDNFSGSESVDYLTEFYTAHFSQNFDGDIGQLSGIDPGGLGGLAALEGLCDPDHLNVSYLDVNDLNYSPIPLYSWTVQAATHEIGHLLGSQHTHDCAWNGNDTPIDSCGTSAGFPGDGDCITAGIPQEGGTIMSYCHLTWAGINLANGFGPQPAQRIQNFVNSAQCVGTSCAAASCHSYTTSLSVGNVTTTAAAVSWEDESNGPWEVSYAITGNTAGEWQEAATTTVLLNELLPNTYYTVVLRPVCADGTAPDVLLTFATPADWCLGQQFRDPGGDNQFYELNQDVVRTLTPGGEGQKIKVNFTEFSLEDNFDFLEIYDGPDTNAPLLGTFTGFGSPGEFTSTAADGSLTFHFTSDDQVNSTGWNATVTCQSGLGTALNTLANFTYYPNPAHNSINMQATEPITEISIYSVTGQLLLTKKVNATQTTADVSLFPNGVYFVKARGASKQANFRILKQ